MFFTYEVQTGETLDTLSQRFDTTVEEIMSLNEIRNPNRIPDKIIIRIPGPMFPPSVPSPRPQANFQTRRIGDILYILSTDRMLYLRNQLVNISLIKINISDRPIALNYQTSQRFDFFVRQGMSGRNLWQWSADRVFAQVTDRIILPPGGSQVFRTSWDQRTNEGRHVGRGIFVVQGENVARQLRGQRVSLRIRIS